MQSRVTFLLLITASILLLWLTFSLLQHKSADVLEKKSFADKSDNQTQAGSAKAITAAPMGNGSGAVLGSNLSGNVTNVTPIMSGPGLTRAVAMEQILSAMLTYSDEGVEKISVFLGSSDQEVRRAAAEALKQIRTDSSAKALRDAAKQATTKEEKMYFSQAAEFVELPVYNPRKRRDRKVEVQIID